MVTRFFCFWAMVRQSVVVGNMGRARLIRSEWPGKGWAKKWLREEEARDKLYSSRSLVPSPTPPSHHSQDPTPEQ